MTRPFKSVEELEQAIKDTRQFSTGDTAKILLAIPMMIKQNQQIIELLKGKKRRRTNWNAYVSKGLKAGLTMRQIADNWKFIKGHYSK